jgi:hypothetical protein
MLLQDVSQVLTLLGTCKVISKPIIAIAGVSDRQQHCSAQPIMSRSVMASMLS